VFGAYLIPLCPELCRLCIRPSQHVGSVEGGAHKTKGGIRKGPGVCSYRGQEALRLQDT
jgi:hypothetical protein